MDRQTSKALILCGSLLSMTLGCSKGEDSSDLAASTVECAPPSTPVQANVPERPSRTEETRDPSRVLDRTFSNSDDVRDSRNFCYTKNNRRRSLNRDIAVDSNGYPEKDENNDYIPVNEPCDDSKDIANDGTLTRKKLYDDARQDQREQRAQDAADRYSRPTSDSAAAIANSPRCKVTPGTGSVADNLDSKNGSERRAPGTVAAGTSGLPPAADGKAPDAKIPIDLMNAGRGVPPSPGQQTEPAPAPAPGPTSSDGGKQSCEGGLIGGKLGTSCTTVNGNTTPTLPR